MMDGAAPIDSLVDVLRAICDELPQHESRLNGLDAAVGDGDHGFTITRCCSAMGEQVGLFMDPSVGQALESVGMAVVARAGGASGALLGSALVAAGRSAAADGPAGAASAARMLDAAQRAVASRGRVEPGDKTMLDALLPAATEAGRVADAGGSVADVIGAAADAAERGAAATGDMIGRAGRAGRLGERSLGHPDPGAVSVALMLRIAADRLRSEGAT